jgi:hypothetical protein
VSHQIIHELRVGKSWPPSSRAQRKRSLSRHFRRVPREYRRDDPCTDPGRRPRRLLVGITFFISPKGLLYDGYYFSRKIFNF